MTRVREEESGFTLIELLVSMAILTVVLGAILTAFADFTNADQRNKRQSEAQDAARTGTDRLARDLRNLASPTNELPQAIDKAEPYDLVFKSVEGVLPGGSQNTWNTRRVRYCLDDSDPLNEKLYEQVQNWTSAAMPPVLSTVSCPDPAWPTTRLVVENLVNRRGGRDRPVFDYTGGPVLTDITAVRSNLFVDVDPRDEMRGTRLNTGVFLRNQNRVPVALFNVSVRGRTIVMNGSGSEDPEADNLKYEWFVDGVEVGDGVVVSHTVPGSGPRTVSVTLKVYDPAGLEGVAGPQQVRVQ